MSVRNSQKEREKDVGGRVHNREMNEVKEDTSNYSIEILKLIKEERSI